MNGGEEGGWVSAGSTKLLGNSKNKIKRTYFFTITCSFKCGFMFSSFSLMVQITDMFTNKFTTKMLDLVLSTPAPVSVERN